MAVYGYARTSTPWWIDKQVDRLRKSGCAVVFNEVRSVDDPPGDAWRDLIDTVQPGDTVRVVELSRLTRHRETAEFMLNTLGELGVQVQVVELPPD